eukprot:CAMPEP_0177467866 /NCGR_PEP_ID=MMETSP0369-20130122/18752_1 /TAXON_ID=447022 ORGANISM="Scrippsiella hangoei-like, Strain SHHI-4" /NCGR_SAMPLE_ID=MMETSP0369 /ASSEMBLY_ACC=CAM_ASM_000364 /LENGTH=468 /DNA_ID=CAMNT_0018941999 /DNA_START=24 /DNA_END=1431 /DNA_ORIENTATION=+
MTAQDKEDEGGPLPRAMGFSAGPVAQGKDYGFGQPMELPEGEPIWPIREDQKPEIVHTVAEFLEAMLFQPHVDRCVVLPNGVELLGQQHAIPEVVRQACVSAASASSSGPARKRGNNNTGAHQMRSFLKALGKTQQARFRSRLWHYGIPGKEKEVKGKGTKKKTLQEVSEILEEEEEKGMVPRDAPLYISEMRWEAKRPHPLVQAETVKCATSTDIYDFTPLARRMPLWERSEGGIFIGERGTGSGMHTDQCLWSNVGRNWCGFKLFAVWPWEERHTIPKEVGKGRIFHMPLSAQEEGWLARAKVLALVRPGDVWVFSGGQPHTALVVGDGLNISAYESLVPAHSDAIGVLVRSNTKKDHPENFWMDDEDLDELYEDVVDNLQRSLREPKLDARLRGELENCVKAMRERGDAYCRELWEQEDRGERRRRREEESSCFESDSMGAEAGQNGEPKAKKAKTKTSSEPRSA